MKIKINKNNEKFSVSKCKDLFSYSCGNTPKKENDNYEGNVPWVNISDLGDKYITRTKKKILDTTKIVEENSLLISFKLSVGVCSINKIPVSTNEAIIRIEPSKLKTEIDIEDLYYILPREFLKNCGKNAYGANVLTTDVIKNIEIKIPKNIKKITTVLSKYDSRLNSIKKLLEKIEIRNNYYADKLLSGELSIDEDGQLLKSNNLYDYKNLGELCDIKTGRKDANAGSEEGLYSFFTCSQETKKINEYSFDCEAILIAGNGIPGVCKYINGKFDAYQRVYVLNNFKENVSYIYKYMNSKFKKQIDNETQGAVIQYIKIDNIKDFKIAIPDEKTQNNIIKFLDNLENEKSKVEKLLELEEKRFEWLSDKLLSGEYIIEQ